MSFEEIVQLLEEISQSNIIHLVIAIVTIWAVLVAVRSARVAAKSSEESSSIAKENTAHNAALLEQADKHHRLSVRPLMIKFERFTIENDGVSFVVGVKNVGVGPAVIRSIRFFFKKEEVISSGNWSDAPLELCRRCLAGTEIRGWSKAHGSLGQGAAIAHGDETVFLHAFFPFEQRPGDRTSKLTADQIKTTVRNACGDSGYVVNYTSIYGDEDFKPVSSN
jgi:hypothetical protein